ncbi:MAG: hypothetical protein IT279_10725 [Ignavibacteriaceae bacterium]|nr:hypothetical protein [Ignavibacteriaceae bacterium]
MGQQQLLLIVLGVIIVGISIVVGINLFQSSAVQANKDALISDLNNLGALSLQYYKKPSAQGGGGRVFTGFAIPTNLASTANGTYAITANTGAVITFTGTGKELGANGSAVKATIAVTGSTGAMVTTITNP